MCQFCDVQAEATESVVVSVAASAAATAADVFPNRPFSCRSRCSNS